MSSLLDTSLLPPPPLLDNLAPELYGTFGFDPLFPLGSTSTFHSPSSSSSDNDFSAPPTSPESPSSSSPPPFKPEIDTTWTGSMESQLTEPPIINPILAPGFQLNSIPANARKRRSNPTNRKSARGGRARVGARTGTGGRKKTHRVSPPLTPSLPLPSTPVLPTTPVAPSPLVDGGVPIDPSHLRELMHESALKQQRLKRKAELARLSRKKKQLKMGDLEKQVALLKEQNQRLSSQNAMLLAQRGKVDCKDTKVHVPSQAPPSQPMPTATTIEQAIGAINELFLKQSSDASLDEAKVSHLIGVVADSLKENTSGLESSLKKIERTLVPCTAMQFLEWALLQRDKFYQEENGLFMSLFRDEMNATPTQITQLLSLRAQMQQKTVKMKDQVLVDAFRAFEKVLMERGRLQQSNSFEQLRSIFTPRQLATYFRYVSQYGAVLIKVPV